LSCCHVNTMEEEANHLFVASAIDDGKSEHCDK